MDSVRQYDRHFRAFNGEEEKKRPTKKTRSGKSRRGRVGLRPTKHKPGTGRYSPLHRRVANRCQLFVLFIDRLVHRLLDVNAWVSIHSRSLGSDAPLATAACTHTYEILTSGMRCHLHSRCICALQCGSEKTSALPIRGKLLPPSGRKGSLKNQRLLEDQATECCIVTLLSSAA